MAAEPKSLTAVASAPAAKTSCKIMECNCTHEYQSKKYGPRMRVHNPGKAPAAGRTPYTCTVCGSKK